MPENGMGHQLRKLQHKGHIFTSEEELLANVAITWKVHGTAAYNLLMEGHVRMARELILDGLRNIDGYKKEAG